MKDARRPAIADDVESALKRLDIYELNAAGILLGLYGCREGGSESLLGYVPGYAAERASVVASVRIKLGIDLPAAELLDLMPGWSDLLS